MAQFVSSLQILLKNMFTKQRASRFGFNTAGHVIPVPNPGGRNITLIAAMDSLQGLGIKGVIPWRLKADMQHFKRLTVDHPVIMGRKTFESLGSKPLPQRTNIVISRDPHYADKIVGGEWVAVCNSLENALHLAGDQQIFIIGGGVIYEKALPLCDDMVITHVEDVYVTDAKFPTIPKREFLEPVFSRHKEGPATFRYTYWRRRKSE